MHPYTPSPRWTAAMLRRDLHTRAQHLALTHGMLHEISPGASPALLFGRDDHGRHGNFHPASYQAICAHPEWLRRLAKPHTASRRSRARKDWRWMELDSANSSDALLMNVFCHPGVFDGATLAPGVAALLNVDAAAQPCFGAHPGVPLARTLKPRTKSAAPRDALDRTEIDLALTAPSGTLFLEAKLTENDFQTCAPPLLARYRDLDEVFDIARLPHRLIEPPPLPPNVDPDDPTVNLPTRTPKPCIAGYQLIRNVLAAYAAGASFCVLLDARRRDLIESWFTVLSAVHAPTFTPRLKLLTWQELSAALPTELQKFLDTKYGIRTL